MDKQNRKTVAVTMPRELYEQLNLLAAENCYTLPGYIRQLLRVYVREQEDQ